MTGLLLGAGLKWLIGSAGLGGLGYLGWARGWLQRVPRRAWLIIGGVVAAVLLVWWHQHHMHRLLADADQAGYSRRVEEDRQQAARIDKQVTDVTVPIAESHRSQNDASLSQIHATAAAQRVRGPGAAECHDPALSAPSGGPVQSSGTGDAALPRVPYPEWSALLAVPSDDAVAFAEQHDAFRTEALTWRGWYRDEYAAWEKLRATVQRPSRTPQAR